MKSHKYWSIGAMITMLGTFYTGYKGSKEAIVLCSKFFALHDYGYLYRTQDDFW